MEAVHNRISSGTQFACVDTRASSPLRVECRFRVGFRIIPATEIDFFQAIHFWRRFLRRALLRCSTDVHRTRACEHQQSNDSHKTVLDENATHVSLLGFLTIHNLMICNLAEQLIAVAPEYTSSTLVRSSSTLYFRSIAAPLSREYNSVVTRCRTHAGLAIRAKPGFFPVAFRRPPEALHGYQCHYQNRCKRRKLFTGISCPA